MKLKFFTVAVVLLAMTSCGSKSDKADNAPKDDVETADEMTCDELTCSDDLNVNMDDIKSAADEYLSSSDFESDNDDSSNDEDAYSSSSSSYSSENTSASSEVDDMLDEYENFVDEYISLLKKAANGDVSAVSNYARYMQSAQELSKKLDKFTGKMNAAQTGRYMNITNKLTQAASGF